MMSPVMIGLDAAHQRALIETIRQQTEVIVDAAEATLRMFSGP